MTARIQYTVSMNTLLTAPAVGGFALVGLLLLCFLLVHILRLAEIGWKHKNERPTTQPPPEKKPEPPQRAEPIYYIVEKKRKPRPKPNYSEPKEIKFK